MNEEKFDRILKRFLEGSATASEQQLVDQWLESFSGQSFEQIPVPEREAIKHRMQENLLKRIQPQPILRLPWYRQITWQLAAMLVVVLGVGLSGYRYWTNRVVPLMAYADARTIHKVILPDGSLVWLKDSSRLDYPSRFTGSIREVTLRGEALFEVAKNPERPFIIHSGNMTTKVLGTSFNIRYRHEQTEVAVFTGQVKLSSPAGQVTLLPAQKAVYQNQQVKPRILKPDEPETLAYTAGTEYLMRFDDNPMIEILNRIEKKFNVQITTDHPTLGSCLWTADLTDQSLENTLSILTVNFGGSYQIKGSTVQLTGLSCH